MGGEKLEHEGKAKRDTEADKNGAWGEDRTRGCV